MASTDDYPSSYQLSVVLGSPAGAGADVSGGMAHSLLSSNVHISGDRLWLPEGQADAHRRRACGKCNRREDPLLGAGEGSLQRHADEDANRASAHSNGGRSEPSERPAVETPGNPPHLEIVTPSLLI